MAGEPLAMGANYRAVARAVRELHRLREVGLEDSPDADAIRDANDAAWESLSEAERRRISGLSEDLYSLSAPRSGPRAIDPHAQARLGEVRQAQQSGDWDRALDLLRGVSEQLPPALVSFLRGSIWREAGDTETAVLFLDHATRLEPHNADYQTS